MSDSLDVLWLSASPSLQRFDQPLLKYLAKSVKIAQWEYHQGKDEASCIDQAVELLDEFPGWSDGLRPTVGHRQMHLAGHGMGGVIALAFARRFPERVRSLTLLAVAAQPANTWHAHYYVQRQMFSISREQILVTNVRSLFGQQPPQTLKKLVTALDRDLEESPCMHSLFRLINLPKGGVAMPMMVSGSKTDPVVNQSALYDWLNWLKPKDILWECPGGNHFFHYFHPQLVGEQILNFWQGIEINSQPVTPNLELTFASELN